MKSLLVYWIDLSCWFAFRHWVPAWRRLYPANFVSGPPVTPRNYFSVSSYSFVEARSWMMSKMLMVIWLDCMILLLHSGNPQYKYYYSSPDQIVKVSVSLYDCHMLSFLVHALCSLSSWSKTSEGRNLSESNLIYSYKFATSIKI